MISLHISEIKTYQINTSHTKDKAHSGRQIPLKIKRVIRKIFKNKKHVTVTASILDKTFNLKPISRNDKVKKIKIKVKVPSTAIHWI